MKLSEELKNNVLNLIKGLLVNLSDKEFQRRIWIKGEGPEWDSFDDAMCDFFPQVEGVLEEREQFGLTENQYKVLNDFRDRLQKFSDENDLPELFIDTPEWDEITKMAKEVLKAFNYESRKAN